MKYIGIVVAALGIIALAAGGVFVGIALHENSVITTQLRDQQVTLGLTKDQIAQGQVVDNAAEAQTAASTLGDHLKTIAPTYGALMAKSATGKFDPTNATDLTYGQGLTLENAMNLVVLGYGVDQAILGTGAALIVVGLGMGATGLIVYRVVAKKEQAVEERDIRDARLVQAPSAAGK